MKNNENQLIYKPNVSERNMQDLFWSNVSQIGHGKNMFQQYKVRAGEMIHAMNIMFQHVFGKEIKITLRANEITFLNQQVRPLFSGKVVHVTNGYITLDPVALILSERNHYRFQTPLHFPIERISNFVTEDQENEK
ncbi:hypothetical protein [Halalkalibacter alkalisediminis]|uniref:Uncharacterized protein n=1 Tax=Halalkalibacter alkalisediminis TaxID=935616 RepID=A0ABV6NNS5_9BACI|nr:hypothetical protein [Halalkalibacter alkalisediminis]